MPRKKPSGEVAKNRYQPLGLLLILLGGVLAVGTVVAVPAQSLASNGIFNVTLSIAQGQGTVCYAGANSACTTNTVTGRFSDSEQVTFTAQNSVNPWVFDHWNLPCQPSQACVIYQNPYTVTIPFGTTISAVYVGGQVTVTTTGTKPALTVNGPTSLPLGSTFSFTAGNMYQGDAFEFDAYQSNNQFISHLYQGQADNAGTFTGTATIWATATPEARTFKFSTTRIICTRTTCSSKSLTP